MGGWGGHLHWANQGRPSSPLKPKHATHRQLIINNCPLYFRSSEMRLPWLFGLWWTNLIDRGPNRWNIRNSINLFAFLSTCPMIWDHSIEGNSFHSFEFVFSPGCGITMSTTSPNADKHNTSISLLSIFKSLERKSQKTVKFCPSWTIFKSQRR